MGEEKNMQKRKSFPWIPVLIAIAVLAVILPAGGFAFAATQEQHDVFCSSCHTQPESVYYQRSLSSQPVDLASAHKAKQVNCIDCHSGQSIPGRLSAELMGARNAFMWFTGLAVQPAVLTNPIGDANCLKCHQQVVSQTGGSPPGGGEGRGFQGQDRVRGEGRPNHYHYFLARWQAADPNATGCVSCHSGHSTNSSGQFAYQNQAQTQAVCDACHQVLRTGD